MKILGLGNALVDVLALIEDDKQLEKMNLPKGSMQLIDEERMYVLSSTIEDVEKHLASGGSASNTITGMAKLGINTGFLGKIGKDYYGVYYKSDLEKYGVELHLTEVDNLSGVATTFISKDGERTFGTFLGAAATLTPDDIKEDTFLGYTHVYIEGYLLQNPELILKSFQIAKRSGIKIILDLASYNVVEENRDLLLKIIPEYVDILFANEEESKALVNLPPAEAIERLSKDVGITIIKVGSAGSWIKSKDEESIFVPSQKVNAIDTTGAGDYYAAGFLYGLMKKYPLSLCGEIGTLLASSVIQVIGAKLEEKHWEEIMEKL